MRRSKREQNTLVYKTENLESYDSALIADFLRYMMVEQGIGFSFETVMSHEAKISFLEFAKDKKLYPSFVISTGKSEPHKGERV